MFADIILVVFTFIGIAIILFKNQSKIGTWAATKYDKNLDWRD